MHSAREMEALGTECSLRERRADEAARSVVAWLKCEYMRPRIGEEFDAVVTGVTDFGLFVQLKEIQVDGLVHVTALPRDYFHFHEADRTLVGERTRAAVLDRRRAAGAAVRVDSAERKIDFEHVAKTGTHHHPRRRAAQGARAPQVSGSLVYGLHAVRAVLGRRPEDVLRLVDRRRPRRRAGAGAARARGGQGVKAGPLRRRRRSTPRRAARPTRASSPKCARACRSTRTRCSTC